MHIKCWSHCWILFCLQTWYIYDLQVNMHAWSHLLLWLGSIYWLIAKFRYIQHSDICKTSRQVNKGKDILCSCLCYSTLPSACGLIAWSSSCTACTVGDVVKHLGLFFWEMWLTGLLKYETETWPGNDATQICTCHHVACWVTCLSIYIVTIRTQYLWQTTYGRNWSDCGSRCTCRNAQIHGKLCASVR